MNNIALQLQQLVRQGMDIKDAAALCEVDLDEAGALVKAPVNTGRVTSQQIAREYSETRGLSILMDIADNYNAEPKDRIRAIEIIKKDFAGDIDGKQSDMSKRWENMRRAIGKVVEKPQQPVVDVKDIGEKCFDLVAA